MRRWRACRSRIPDRLRPQLGAVSIEALRWRQLAVKSWRSGKHRGVCLAGRGAFEVFETRAFWAGDRRLRRDPIGLDIHLVTALQSR